MARASSPPLGINSELPHRCRERCDFCRDTYFRKNSPHSNGPNFLRIRGLLVIHDTVFRDVGGVLLRFCPLIIIELFRGWVFFPTSRT